MKLTPLIKGIITSILMLAVTLATFYQTPENSALRTLPTYVYAAGIIWTLIAFSSSPAYAGKFGQLFSQGFRCFIVATLFMAVFNFIFISNHPEFRDRDVIEVTKQLDKEKNKTPAQKEEIIANFKKTYITQNISFTIFGYLILGAVFTAAGSVLVLLIRKK